MYQLLLMLNIIIFFFLIGPSRLESFFCSDCHTASYNVPKGDTIKVKCPINNPFCNFTTGTCQKMADTQCGQKDDFVCKSDGIMLDGNCTIYHDCSNKKKYECQVPGEIFDPTKSECSAGKCGFFNCTQKFITPHSVFPQFYASCAKNKTLIIYKCHDKYEFIENKCQFKCRSEGLFRDFDDCTKFFKCLQNLTLYHLNCPRMMGFDQKSFMCIPSDKIPSCIGKNQTIYYPNITDNHNYNLTNSHIIKYDIDCYENGIFPDVNCTKFHICKDLKPISYQCNPGLTYSLTGCVKTNQCGTYDCKTLGIKVKHSIFKNYYKFCIDKITALFKCPGKYELNSTSQICEPICHRPGNIENLDNCTLYYECKISYIDNKITHFNKNIKKCPNGTVFHPFLQICVYSDSVYLPNCKYTHVFVSSCLKQLNPECRIVDNKGLKKNCVIQYLQVGGKPECKEEIKALMGKIMNKNVH